MSLLAYVTVHAIVVTIIVLLILSFIGVQNLIARILYTILIIFPIYTFFKKLYKYVIYTLDGKKQNNRKLTLSFFLDIMVSYFFVLTLLLFLTWVWGEDAFFTFMKSWNDTTVIQSYTNHFYLTLVTCTGQAPAIHLPRPDFVWSFVVMIPISLLTWFLFLLILPFAINFVLETNESNNNNNNNKYSTPQNLQSQKPIESNINIKNF